MSCERSHTSRTFAVPSVPRGVPMGDTDALQRVVDRACRPAYHRAVSTDIRERLLSAYSYVWFAPTDQQVRQGARWVRCDLVVFGGTSTLVPLPPAQVPALGTAPYPDREARCYVGRRFLVTACSRPHQLRARSVYQLRAGRYPSEAELQRTAERRCAPVAGRRWTAFPPSREDWRGGFRYVVCTSRTSR